MADFSVDYKNPVWKKYGLSIDVSIRYGSKFRYEKTIKYHNLVANYLERHSEKVGLFEDKAHFGYYHILKLAEQEEKEKE